MHGVILGVNKAFISCESSTDDSHEIKSLISKKYQALFVLKKIHASHLPIIHMK